MDLSEIVAGYNHSLALSRKGRPYTWGFYRKGVLGRELGVDLHLENENYFDKKKLDHTLIALPVLIGPDLFKAKKNNPGINDDVLERWRPHRKDDSMDEKDVVKAQKGKEKGVKGVMKPKRNDEDGDEAYIISVKCGSNNTVSLTSAGTVHVLGDNTFGQHGCEVDSM